MGTRGERLNIPLNKYLSILGRDYIVLFLWLYYSCMFLPFFAVLSFRFDNLSFQSLNQQLHKYHIPKDQPSHTHTQSKVIPLQFHLFSFLPVYYASYHPTHFLLIPRTPVISHFSLFIFLHLHHSPRTPSPPTTRPILSKPRPSWRVRLG